MVDYDISIEDCNSIDTAKICVKKASLNIMFGSNGLGKSTIAKAFVSKARNERTLAELIPFKSDGKAGAAQPKVDGIGHVVSPVQTSQDEQVSKRINDFGRVQLSLHPDRKAFSAVLV